VSVTTAVKARVATAWLDGCSGCHMSLLDIDEALVALAGRIELVFSPLVDAQEYPENVDVALVEGAVSSQDDLKLLQTIRQRTKFLVALGDCAVTGNVPAMRNNIPVKKLLESIYIQGVTTAPGVPKDGVPALLRHASPLHESVRVDLHVPGCPPKPDAIAFVLKELLDGHKIDLTGQVKFG
jgi:NAD-reducing hydrogenase small subunit